MSRSVEVVSDADRGKDTDRRNHYVPLVVVLSWWALCFALYVGGWPIRYERANLGLVSALVLATVLCVIFGYRSGLAWGGRNPGAKRVGRDIWPWVGLVLSLVLFVPEVSSYSGIAVSDVQSAFRDQSAAYQQATETIKMGSAQRVALVAILTAAAPFTLTALPYFALRSFRGERRFLLPFALAAVPMIVLSVLTGRDQRLGVIVIVGAGAWLVAQSQAGRPIGKKSIGVGGMILLAVTLLKGVRNLERNEDRFICPPGQLNCDTEPDSIMSQALLTGASYASQGFEGLSRALDATWSFGGGYSHSPALSNLFESILNIQQYGTITDQLYAHGWSDTAYWSTALTQLANDVHWVLVPFVVGAVSFLLARAWLAARIGGWLEVTLFSYLLMALVFVPQNYQLGASGSTYIGFMALSVIWLAQAHRRRTLIKA